MNKAKKAKNNEFYTRIADIEAEIIASGCYDGCFQGKTVLCNCNDMGKNAFLRFFVMRFDQLGLKRLITVSYGDNAKVGVYDGEHTEYYPLSGDGDFRSEEGIEILKHADIVVTNPPFSLFRKFIELLFEYNKDFIIIGNHDSVTCKNIFPLFMKGQLHFGCTKVKDFYTPDVKKKEGTVGWYTNLNISKTPELLELTKTYYGHEDEYPKYDNFNAIEVDRVKDIPYDYDGLMGVPPSFLEKYYPQQFAIVGEANHGTDSEYDLFVPTVHGKEKEIWQRIIIKNLQAVGTSAELAGPAVDHGTFLENPGRFYIDGKKKYDRVVIKLTRGTESRHDGAKTPLSN